MEGERDRETEQKEGGDKASRREGEVGRERERGERGREREREREKEREQRERRERRERGKKHERARACESEEHHGHALHPGAEGLPDKLGREVKGRAHPPLLVPNVLYVPLLLPTVLYVPLLVPTVLYVFRLSYMSRGTREGERNGGRES